MSSKEVDPIDEADRIEQAINDKRIAVIRSKVAELKTSNPLGSCWHCGENTGHERRWCDRYCSDMWVMENE